MIEHGGIDLEFDSNCYDVATAALAMLAFGLSELSPTEREGRLVGIEDQLRQAAKRFDLCKPSSPYPRANGNGHAR